MNASEHEIRVKKRKRRRLLAICILAVLLILCGVYFCRYSFGMNKANRILYAHGSVGYGISYDRVSAEGTAGTALNILL